jgi:hypothetical protein
MKEELQKQIDEIMLNFKFDRVEATMKALNWTWFDTNGVPPSEEQIRVMALGLLKDAYKRNTTIRTGGFRAGYDSKEEFFTIEFIVSQWETSDYY